MRAKIFGLAMVCTIASFFGSVPCTAVADCGKMIIIVHRGPLIVRPPRPFLIHQQPQYVPMPMPTIPNYGQGNQVQQQQQQTLNNANNNVININPATGVVPPPPPASGGAFAYGDKAFLEGAQQAVIAWNGRTDEQGEQTLILTTNEISNTGEDMAMLSVLPLPGKPKSIEKANAKVFVQTKILLDKKIRETNPSAGGAVGFGVIMTAKIGSHNIFVWEMEDISTFKDDVTAYIAKTYNNEATALVTDKALQIIKGYHDRGFRYFAFDLTEVKKNATTKEAIAYRFQSTFAYYPLAISGIGGTGHGLIDLIVMTPGQINLRGAFEQGKEEAPIIVKGRTSVDFTMNEVKELDPSLAGVFDGSGLNSVRVRNFLIEAEDIGGFKSDFIATPAR